MKLLLWIFVTLLLTTAGSSTPCAASGQGPLVLANHSSYLFANCAIPLNASGIDITDVTMAFVDAAPGLILLSGSRVANLFISLANVNHAAAMAVVLNVSQLVSNVSLVIVNSTVVSPTSALVSMRSAAITLQEARDVNISLFGSSVRGQGLLDIGMINVLANFNIFTLASNVSSSEYVTMIRLSPLSSASNIIISVDQSNVLTTGGGHLVHATGGVVCSWSNFSLLVKHDSNITLVSAPNYVSHVLYWSGIGTMTSFSFIACCGSRLDVGKVTWFGMSGPTRQLDSIVYSFNNVRISILYALVAISNSLDSIANVEILVMNASEVLLKELLFSEGMSGLRKVVENLTVSIESSVVYASSSTFITFAPIMARWIALVVIDSTIKGHTGNCLLCLSFDESSRASDACSINTTIVSSTLNFSSATSLLEVWGSSRAADLHVSVHGSVCTELTVVVYGNLGKPCLGNITLDVRSSQISAYFPVFQLGNASCIGDVHVMFENATFLSTSASVISFLQIHSIDALVTVTMRKNSTVLVTRPRAMTSVFFATAAVTSVRSLVSVVIEDSVVRNIVSSAFFIIALVQLSGFTVEAHGAFACAVLGSTIDYAQTLPTGIDACGIFSVVGVIGELSFRIDQRSFVSIACVASASVISFQASENAVVRFTAAGGSILHISTTAQQVRSPLTSLLTGSFVVLIVNSRISNSFFSVSDCNITCGLVCQVFGEGWNYGFYYDFGLTSIMGNLPQPVFTAISNTTVELLKSTVTRFASLVSLPLRPLGLFSFINATNMTVVIQGPCELSIGGFNGLASGGMAIGANQLQLVNCDQIFSRAAGDSPVILLEMPIRVMIGITVTSLKSDGEGTCALTATHMFTLTSSASQSLTDGSRSQSAAKEVLAFDLLPSAASALRTSSTIALLSSVPLAAFDPLGGAAMQQSAFVAFMIGCGSDVESSALPRSWSPLQLTIGDDIHARHLIGAAVGNTCLFLMFGALALTSAVIAAYVAPARRRGRGSRLFSGRVVAAAARLNLPGWLISPTTFLLQPTISCAGASIGAGSGAGVAGGIFALVVFSAALAGPLLLVTRYRGHLCSQLRVDAKRSVLVAVAAGRRSWHLNGLLPWRLQHVGRVVMRYGWRRPWYLCVDVGQWVALGICGAVQLSSRDGCSAGTEWAVLSILATGLVMRIALRPYASALRNTANIVSEGLFTAAMLLAASHAASPAVCGHVAVAGAYVLCGLQLLATVISLTAGKGRLLFSLVLAKQRAHAGLGRREGKEQVVADILMMDSRLSLLILLACLKKESKTN